MSLKSMEEPEGERRAAWALTALEGDGPMMAVKSIFEWNLFLKYVEF